MTLCKVMDRRRWFSRRLSIASSSTCLLVFIICADIQSLVALRLLGLSRFPSLGGIGDLLKPRPGALYLGLYKPNNTEQLTSFKMDLVQRRCYDYKAGDNTTEHCRLYGDCCVDPMRMREKLELGTFSCQQTPAYPGKIHTANFACWL